MEFKDLAIFRDGVGALLHVLGDEVWPLRQRARLLRLAATNEAWGDADRRARLEVEFLAGAHLVLSTLNSAARLITVAPFAAPFRAVVVDEAAQATEPSVLIPLQLARAARCILVGDDRQLPPSTTGASAMFARSLFERLHDFGHARHLLAQQYRMHPAISLFPRRHFYAGELKDAPNVVDLAWHPGLADFPAFLFLDLRSSAAERVGSSWSNPEEAGLLRIIADDVRQTVDETDVGVITFYRPQRDLLARLLPGMHVSTVDAFQGQEKRVILLSTVRAPEDLLERAGGVGFLKDERRMCVALTRAQSLLIVIGHATTLLRNPSWGALVRHAHAEGVLDHLRCSGDYKQTLLQRRSAAAVSGVDVEVRSHASQVDQGPALGVDFSAATCPTMRPGRTPRPFQGRLREPASPACPPHAQAAGAAQVAQEAQAARAAQAAQVTRAAQAALASQAAHAALAAIATRAAQSTPAAFSSPSAVEVVDLT